LVRAWQQRKGSWPLSADNVPPLSQQQVEYVGGYRRNFGWNWPVFRGDVAALRKLEVPGQPPPPLNRRQLVPNRFIAFGYGVLAGGATQSMSYLTFVTVGILRANLITTERALPFIVGGNVGVISIVFFVSFDIELAALYILGPASLFMVIERSLKFHTLGALLFGLALMFVGLALVKDSAASFSTQPWFGEFLELAARSLWISFLLATILTFIVQSAVAVMVFGITLGAIGVLTADQVIMLIYGSAIGSSLSVLALSLDLRACLQSLQD
jgi:phosphate:Na+ symporter